MLQNRTLGVALSILVCIPAAWGVDPGARVPGFRADRVEAQRQREAALQEAIDPDRLRDWHTLLGSEPHRAGTGGDLRNIDRMREAFEGMGLSVETHWFEAYLAQPISASLRIASPEEIELSITEPALADDPDTANPDLDIAWNAYSGSGVAEGQVVYANYGRKQDFEQLQKAGVDVAGKIVIARYGGNYRGYKAYYAERAGAIGLVIYTDPGDQGITREELESGVFPETGPTPDQVQRGSILTLDYVGDPLTPNAPADASASRHDPGDVALPTIPVQPIGWRSAREILERMDGDAIPDEWKEEGRWVGGLPIDYRLTGGDELTVRIEVEQERKLVRTANVVGTLVGERFPNQEIIIGAHHDAWGYGAVDPLAGTILVMEAARVMSERAALGDRPARTIQFAAWGAEEYGIIGSTEWVEHHITHLADDAVAYINLDAAVTGPNFWASSAPTLKQLVIDTARDVAHCEQDVSVHEAWLARSGEGAREPRVGSLGGGSDHVALYCVAGVPSIAMGAGGTRGSVYHSNYDTLAWYREHVGDDYQPAAMVARVVALTADRLANADVIPYDATRYARDIRGYLRSMSDRAQEQGVTLDTTRIDAALGELEANAIALNGAIVRALTDGRVTGAALDRLSTEMLALERAWIRARGLPERSWYRSQYVAPDPTSGYSAWMLPGLRWAVEQADQGATDEHAEVVRSIVKRLAVKCRQLREIVEP